MASTEMFATGFQRAPLPRHFGIVCPPPTPQQEPHARPCAMGMAQMRHGGRKRGSGVKQ